MELRLNEKLRAGIEVDGNALITSNDSTVYELTKDGEVYIFVKNSKGNAVKIRIVRNDEIKEDNEEIKKEEIKETENV